MRDGIFHWKRKAFSEFPTNLSKGKLKMIGLDNFKKVPMIPKTMYKGFKSIAFNSGQQMAFLKRALGSELQNFTENVDVLDGANILANRAR